jgi:hypothetical protein
MRDEDEDEGEGESERRHWDFRAKQQDSTINKP